MKFDFFDLTRIFTSLQLILLCLVLLFIKTKGKQYKILALFLFSLASFIICGIYSKLYDLLANENLHFILYILYSFNYLIGPSFYFYIRSVATKSDRFRGINLIHFLPFFLILIFNPLFLHIPGSDIFLFGKNFVADAYFVTVTAFLHLQILTYLVYSLLILKKHRQINEVDNKAKLGKSRFNWMKFLTYSLLVIWTLEGLIYFYYIYFLVSLCLIKIVLAGLNFSLANIIVIVGLKKPEIFNGEPSRSKYNKNILKEKEKHIFLQNLERYMETESPYLHPELSLNSMALKLNISPHQLSQLLNTVLSINFYDYINSYRIEAAKKLLLSCNSQQKTILEIIYEVGFSSKSVFNNAFKKHTGVTPTEFRNHNK